MKDTLERLARLIQRQRTTQGERCHLFITRQGNSDNLSEGYKALAELLRNGYFSTIVTMNPDTLLERALEETSPVPSYQIIVVGRDSDEKVAIALDGQESGICIIKLLLHKNEPLTSDVWESLLGYLQENIVVVGYTNETHNDLVQTLIPERERSSLYYIVPAESDADALLSQMQKSQKQSENFLICGPNGNFVNFFNRLARRLLYNDLLPPEHDIIVDESHSSEGEATDTTGGKDPSTLWPEWPEWPEEDQDWRSTTRPLPDSGERNGSEEQLEHAEPPSVRLEPSKDEMNRLLDEDRLINSGPLELYPSIYAGKEAISELPWPGRVDVLIVTVTSVELRALLARYPERVRRTVHEKTYYDLGYVGRVRTVVVQANDMGPIEAHATVDEGIRSLSPRAVIMTGIAFGVRAKEQQIGDVLVSKLIHDYDSERVGTDEDDQLNSYQRGTRVMASDWLIDRFNAGNNDWNPPPEIHFGSILSGSKLIDNKEYQTALLRSAPDAIGGEMEGVGLSKAANRHRVSWLLVKGISDWADGTKGVNKAANQRLAADNAASFVLFVIGQGDFMHKS